MRFTPVRRLVLSSVLFLAWLGWLAYLTMRTARPMEVLSRPQFLVADWDVIADLQEVNGKPDGRVKVEEVFWARNPQGKPEGTIVVTNLLGLSGREGWQGAGRYIVPLVKDGHDYRIPAIPRSPGFNPRLEDLARIYRTDEDTLGQLHTICKSEIPALAQ